MRANSDRAFFLAWSAECRADPPPPSRDRRPAGCPPSTCSRCSSSPRVTGRISSTFPSATSATGQRCAHSRPDARRGFPREETDVRDARPVVFPRAGSRLGTRPVPFAPNVLATRVRARTNPRVRWTRRARTGRDGTRARAPQRPDRAPRNARIVMGARICATRLNTITRERRVVLSRMNSPRDRAPMTRRCKPNEFFSVDNSLTSCPHPSSPARPRFAGCDRDEG